MSAPDTRERILEVAARLFHEQGYHATGVSTILRESGVNSGSLYHFFPGKEQLLSGVLERYLERLQPEVLDPVERQTDDPIERVFGLLDGYLQMMEFTGCAMGCPVGNLALELSDNHPAIRRLVDRNFQNWIDAVAVWLERAGERLPEQVDRRQLASFVLTVMEGGIMQARARRSPRPLEEAMANLREYFELLSERAGRLA